MKSSFAKERVRTDATLRDQANAVKEKSAGRLIEIVNSGDGKARTELVIEVPLTYEGAVDLAHVGDQLISVHP